MISRFKILDTVKLTKDIQQTSIEKGAIGTIVEQLDDNVFEVEFCNSNGETIALVNLNEKDLDMINPYLENSKDIVDDKAINLNLFYNSNSQIKRSDLDDLFKLSKTFSNFHIANYNRAGAIDLVSYLEIEFVNNYMDIKFIELIKDFLKNLYNGYIKSNLKEKKAVSVIEHFGNKEFYAVLNHVKMTEKLIASLPNTFYSTYKKIVQNEIKLDNDIYVMQLYPNFKSNSWDYLFIPTINGFGKFIDRYYDIVENKIKYIKNSNEFETLFEVDNNDECKFIISSKFHKRH